MAAKPVCTNDNYGTDLEDLLRFNPKVTIDDTTGATAIAISASAVTGLRVTANGQAVHGESAASNSGYFESGASGNTQTTLKILKTAGQSNTIFQFEVNGGSTTVFSVNGRGDVTAFGTADIRGKIDGAAGAEIHQPASIPALQLDGATNNGTNPTLQISNNPASAGNTGIALDVLNKAGAATISVDYAGNTNIGGTLDVDGAATFNAGATATQPGSGAGVAVNARVDDLLEGSVQLLANPGSSTDATAAFTTYNRAGVKKFGIGHNGNFSAEGTGIVVGTFETHTDTILGLIGGDDLTINSAAPTAPNLGTVTPASYLGISSGNVIGKFTPPAFPTTVPKWLKFNISSHALFETTNGVPQTIPIALLARQYVHFISVQTTTAFTGGGIASLTLDPDSAFFLAINSAYDLLAAPADANFTSSFAPTGAKSAGAWNFDMTFTPDAGHNLAALTDGELEFDILVSDLP